MRRRDLSIIMRIEGARVRFRRKQNDWQLKRVVSTMIDDSAKDEKLKGIRLSNESEKKAKFEYLMLGRGEEREA